jgi:septal ring factor EnvC (AmiA/AmiB activator)
MFFVKPMKACDVCYAEGVALVSVPALDEASMDHTADRELPERERLLKQYREQVGHYKSVNAELADLEWTLADVERQIEALRREAAATPDEAIARRLHDLTRWKGSLEEGILQRLYRVEALVAAIARLRAELNLQDAAEPGS